MTRRERVGLVRDYYFEQLDDNEKEFVTFVLKAYEKEGESELGMDKLRGLVSLKYHTMRDAVDKLGTPEEIVQDYLELQEELYSSVK